MRVGLMADTHDRVPVIAEFVRVMQEAGVAMLIHAGDYCAPFSLRPIEEASMSLAGVFGKNDGDIQGLLAKASAGFGAELYEGPHSFEHVSLGSSAGTGGIGARLLASLQISIEQVLRVTLCAQSRPNLIGSESAGEDSGSQLAQEAGVCLEHLLWRLSNCKRRGDDKKCGDSE